MRSLIDIRPWRRLAEPAMAGVGAHALQPRSVLLRGERARLNGSFLGVRFNHPAPRGLETGLALALILSAAVVGAVRGGQYQTFVATQGGVGDYAARLVGMGIQQISMTGQSRLTPREVLAIAGISPKNSMPFLDVDAARQRLEANPLIKQASVRKLYPGEITIDMIERTPAALWQKNGEVKTIAADGAVIDELRDINFSDLPFVVGDGANERLPEFRALLDETQELRPKIGAGVLVDGRRWNLRMLNGLDVKLPEKDPSAAIATLLKLQREHRIFDRDILSIDLRDPTKAFVKLSSEAAAARAETRPKKGATP